MRIALISDIHGNELALEAVFADIADKGADRIVCLGDTATLGPAPRAVLDLLRRYECPCILGNHDAFLLDEELVHSYSEAPVIIDAVNWCREQLAPSDLAFIAKTFVPSIDLSLGGEQSLLLFHGTPHSHMQDLLSTTPTQELDQLLGGRRATVLAGGHTHLQMLRQHRGMLLVNPGSVGMPFELYVHGKVPTLLAHAEWACVESNGEHISVHLHRVPLERSALRAAARASDNPLAPWLAEQYA